MPHYRIRVTNETVISSVDSEHSNLEQARAEALRGALQIGADEILSGVRFFGAEITIEQEDSSVERSVIGIGHSRLGS